MLLLPVVAIVCAQAQPTHDPRAQDQHLAELLLADLGAEDLATREAAQRVLETLDGSTLPWIERTMAEGSLDPERAQRLSLAAGAVFARTPRAAMGIAFGGQDDRGVLIGSTVAGQGFDAEAKLAAGDVVVEVAGKRVFDQEDLRIEIISRDPGETLPLTIQRQGKTIETAVVLGSFEQLGNAGRIDSQSARLAWEARLARRGLDASWRGPTLSYSDGLVNGQWSVGTPDTGVAGGGVVRAESFGMGWSASPNFTVRERAAILQQRRPGENPFTRPMLMQELADARAKHAVMLQRIADAEREMADPTTAPDRLAALEGDAQRTRLAAEALSREMEDLARRLIDAP